MYNSFYGGIPGQAFEITKIFNNKVELEADLRKRWHSSIGVGQFVMISYGIPDRSYIVSANNTEEPELTVSTTDDVTTYITKSDDGVEVHNYASSSSTNSTYSTPYSENESIDLNNYSKTYNSTLWRKVDLEENVYNEDDWAGREVIFLSNSAQYGLAYELVGSFTGKTPLISVQSKERHADKRPQVFVQYDEQNIDNPELTFWMPKSQLMNQPDVQIESPATVPYIYDITRTSANDKIEGLVTLDEDGIASQVQSSDLAEADRIDHAKLEFHMPTAARFFFGRLFGLKNTGTYTLSDSIINSVPTSALDSTMLNTICLEQFDTYDSEKGATQIVYYASQIKEDFDNLFTVSTSTANAPEVDNRGQNYQIVKNRRISIGDYYINQYSNNIYIVTDLITTTDARSITVEYCGRFEPFLASINTTYNYGQYTTTDGTLYSGTEGYYTKLGQNDITAYTSYDNTDEELGWKFNFDIPKMSSIGIKAITGKAVNDGGSAKAYFTYNETNNTLVYNFEIPRGNAGTLHSYGETLMISVVDDFDEDNQVTTEGNSESEISDALAKYLTNYFFTNNTDDSIRKPSYDEFISIQLKIPVSITDVTNTITSTYWVIPYGDYDDAEGWGSYTIVADEATGGSSEVFEDKAPDWTISKINPPNTSFQTNIVTTESDENETIGYSISLLNKLLTWHDLSELS